MPKPHRIVTIRAEAESLDELRVRLDAQGSTVSSFLRAAIRAAVQAPPGGVAPSLVAREAA